LIRNAFGAFGPGIGATESPRRHGKHGGGAFGVLEF
jgi:hypothetical protein